MRRLFVIPLLGLLLLPGAAIGMPRATGDGTLSVRDATGTITIRASRGAVLGNVEKATTIVFKDYLSNDGTGPIVIGAQTREDKEDGVTTVYSGKSVRFRLIGGRYFLKVVGSGIDLSIVGQGAVTLEGGTVIDDGVYAFNDDEYRSLPNLRLPFSLGALPPQAPGG